MKKIPLNHDKFALVDLDDFLVQAEFRWSAIQEASGNWYAVRRKGNEQVRLAREILNPPEGLFVDHINGNTLDNRRSNLRLADAAQNSANRRNGKHSSQYKGVCWDKRNGRWLARATYRLRDYYIGFFDTEKDAALAYDKKITELAGEFAKLNFPK